MLQNATAELKHEDEASPTKQGSPVKTVMAALTKPKVSYFPHIRLPFDAHWRET